MTDHVDPARACALNEQELWREMVRWSGGRIVERHGVLLVSGPSAYLRVAIRTDPRVDGSTVVLVANTPMHRSSTTLQPSPVIARCAENESMSLPSSVLK